MLVLVTGGAGYIGSQMVRLLVRNKIEVVVVDSLENGHRAAVPVDVPLRVGNIGDDDFLREVFLESEFDAVMHFGGYIAVGESVQKPGMYFRNNVAYTIQLLEMMVEFGVPYFVFSSSAAVYGTPVHIPIPETDPLEPINPYGRSKLMVEQMLPWFDARYGLRAISLRYFNASGAELDGSFGEDHPDETHIIPRALNAARQQHAFPLYGDDYPTRDGTCVRDYIHVIDLCEAHLRALDALQNGHPTDALNVGIGKGYSNKEIVDVVRKVTGIDLAVKTEPRRPGDPAELVADSTRLRKEFSWAPRYSDLETIVGSAWKWRQLHPNGYED